MGKTVICTVGVLLACFAVRSYGGDFYACYTKVKSDESWEKHSRTREHADIVIRFDDNRELGFLAWVEAICLTGKLKKASGTWRSLYSVKVTAAG